jgi:pyridoxamine 5'-phosphate oxidase
MLDIASLREEYRHAGLDESQLDPDPIRQFIAWFDEARAAGIKDVNAMSLATATRDGAPNVRMVLLKAVDERGFVFYTNYDSRKGRELAQNPRAALCIYWSELERQTRICGEALRTTRGESAAYFDSRPPGSRIGSAASPQSSVIASRHELEAAAAALAAAYPAGDIPIPENWGGYRVIPTEIEFWQGRPNRLHDRLRYRLEHGQWIIERLAP